MDSNFVYCVKCAKRFKPVNAYRIFLNELEEVHWSTPEHREYKGGNHIYICSEKCYQDFKKNMKEFWDPNGEY
jgi:YHS domain-containing protein